MRAGPVFTFLKLAKKEYRGTFFSFETGNDWAMSFFLKGDTDAKRVKPLRLNKHKWKKIRPEMKEFVLANWERWEEEQPAFFTEAFKKRVDDDMVPKSNLSVRPTTISTCSRLGITVWYTRNVIVLT